VAKVHRGWGNRMPIRGRAIHRRGLTGAFQRPRGSIRTSGGRSGGLPTPRGPGPRPPPPNRRLTREERDAQLAAAAAAKAEAEPRARIQETHPRHLR